MDARKYLTQYSANVFLKSDPTQEDRRNSEQIFAYHSKSQRKYESFT